MRTQSGEASRALAPRQGLMSTPGPVGPVGRRRAAQSSHSPARPSPAHPGGLLMGGGRPPVLGGLCALPPLTSLQSPLLIRLQQRGGVGWEARQDAAICIFMKSFPLCQAPSARGNVTSHFKPGSVFQEWQLKPPAGRL